jgi:hypothetical protein
MRGEHYSRIRNLMGGIVYGSARPLPAQYTGKRQLLEALLLDAIRIFQGSMHAKKPGERQRFAEVEAWIFSDEADYVFSFVNVCDVLGLSVDAVRTHLSAWKTSRRNEATPVSFTPKSHIRIIQR